jgi:glycosyltransferase involved in cell wall biosynthesis
MSESQNKLNVMQVILTLERGGAQEMVKTLAKYLQKNGCTVKVLAFEDGPMRIDLEKLGIHVDLLRRPRFSVVLLPLYLLEMLRIRRELTHLIDIYNVDIVQTHLLNVLDFVTLYLRSTNRVSLVLWTIHSVEFLPVRLAREPMWLHQLKRAATRLGYRWLSKYVGGFIAVSDKVRSAILNQIGPADDKIFIIRNGVDIQRFSTSGNKAALCSDLAIATNSILIATVGRLTLAKGHRYLIDAVKPVISRFPKAHFIIIGDGELRKELEVQVEKNGVAGYVHFLGTRANISNLLAATDLFVLPSLWEGLSMALLEAMAAAKPIISTAAAGTVEVMIPGQTGLLISPGDSQALAEGIMQMLSDQNQARIMAQAARQHVEINFSAEKNAAEYIALYHRLLESGVKS